MIPVTENYLAAIRARTRTDRVTGHLTLTDGTELDLTAADLMSGSLSIDDQCVTGSELAFGCAYLGQVSLQLRTALSRYAFYGGVLRLQYELQLADGSWEAVPLGVYTIAEAERKALSVSVKGYDNVFRLQKALGGAVLQGDAYHMLAAIADGCGLTLGQSEEEILNLNANAALACQLSSADGVSTYRDCAGAVAALLGGFVTADRQGRLVVRQFAAEPSRTLGPAERSEAGISDFRCDYAAVTLTTTGGSFTAGDAAGDGLILVIDDLPMAEKGLDATRQSMADGLWAVVKELGYTPAEITMPGDPSWEPGDRAALTDAEGTVTAETLVTHFVWKYRGRQTLRGVGRNPHLGGTGDAKTERALRRLQSSTDAKQLIFYSFTNPAALEVTGNTEVPAVTLEFASVQQTSALFLAQMVLDAEPAQDESGAEEELTLTVRYYLNAELLEFSPRQRLAKGAHTMALFYPFAEVPADSVERLSVRLVTGGGTVKIGKGAIRATVTGQGLAGERTWDGTIECEELLGAVEIEPHTVAVGKE